MRTVSTMLLILLVLSPPPTVHGAGKPRFKAADVFQLEFASDPQVSPDGKRIVYVRNFMDMMKDRRRSNLWIIHADGSGHQPLTTGNHSNASPRWSPDGSRIAFISDSSGSPQLHCLWIDSGRRTQLTRLSHAPLTPTWSPDGKQLAFVGFVPAPVKPFITLPRKPKGAEWAAPPKVIRQVHYRADGKGYLEEGNFHVFVVAAEGGTPRQLTSGPYDHGGPRWSPAGSSWAPDGQSLLISANRRKDADFEPLNSEVYEVSLTDGKIRALTNRRGPDSSPVVSPDGKKIAYIGFDDRRQGHQVARLYVMDRDGSNSRVLTGNLDHPVDGPLWTEDSKGIYIRYEDTGDSKIGLVLLDGAVKTLTGGVGGTSLDRPYSSGSFSERAGVVAFTQTTPSHPADVAVVLPGAGKPRRLTELNAGLLGQRALATVEELWFKSSRDGRKVHGWVAKPPDFDPKKKYPLILEIHGGPFANYGPRFSVDVQLYAAAGYVVLYTNPRGSTGYGEEFGNLIHHAYPGDDFDDLMSGVDAVLAGGSIDRDNLFVTGGSGGGVLTAWVVGKTNRFRAAVSAKPVINWYSFVLTSDIYPFFVSYWFPGPPWEHAEHYLKRSPLSLVGNVKTPTMLLTGEADHRTPISESEQFYQALKLRKVDTALVRIPGASHNVADRPSQMIAKAACVLKWFEIYRKRSGAGGEK
jgi:dipeptidyl aminopeptidase/acylaminoacyl peptidase